MDKETGEWQELEKYWGSEKHRVLEYDGSSKPMSSSLEKHLMYDDFIDEPMAKTISKGIDNDERKNT